MYRVTHAHDGVYIGNTQYLLSKMVKFQSALPFFLLASSNIASAFVHNSPKSTQLAFDSIQAQKSTPFYVSQSTNKYGLSTSSLKAVSDDTLTLDQVTSQLSEDQKEFNEKLGSTTTVREAEDVRIFYLGKKGKISSAMAFMRSLPNEDKPKLGAVVNEIKNDMEEKIKVRKDELKEVEMQAILESDRIDVTLPGIRGRRIGYGHRHPLSMTMEKAVDIFVKLGYSTVTEAEKSPEIEEDYYCFEALNCPKDHPARDMQDTFYLTEDMGQLLRTHTSSVQIRHLENNKPPFRIVAPGRVYRRDDIDATHSPIFHQVEILAIEERGNLHLGHLKGTVDHFLKNMFGPDIKVRYRGSYFPFTEPSMEVDVFFRGKWLEVLGCGMVDPNVLEMAGIDPEKYSGFAAGFGVERFAMVTHQIPDIREFYNSDLRFLEQFPHFYDAGMNDFLRGSGETVDNDEGKLPLGMDMELREIDGKPCTPDGKIIVEEEPEAEAPKSKKKKKKKKKADPVPAGDIDVSKLDIRVGVITKAWEHTEADKLFCEEIDIGEESGPRSIASGLRAHYNLEDLEGQRVLVLANLKSRKLVGFPSHGMVMCAASEDGSKVEFIEPPADAKIGERVMVDGFDGEPATENQIIKKKMLDAIFPDLVTNEDGVATYKGKEFSTSSGPCVAQNKMPNSQVS